MSAVLSRRKPRCRHARGRAANAPVANLQEQDDQVGAPHGCPEGAALDLLSALGAALSHPARPGGPPMLRRLLRHAHVRLCCKRESRGQRWSRGTKCDAAAR